LPKAERRASRVTKVTDGLEKLDGSGLIAFRVSRPHSAWASGPYADLVRCPSLGYNYLAFDVIGDLSFGSPFGMLKAAKDAAPVARSQSNALATYGDEKVEVDVEYFPAVKILNDRGDYSASMGVLPPWVRPLFKKFHPWYRSGSIATANLTGLAIAAISKRLKSTTDRVDLLSKLQGSKDDEGKPMGPPELTAEALTQLIAGSDTTSK